MNDRAVNLMKDIALRYDNEQNPLNENIRTTQAAQLFEGRNWPL